MPFNNQEMIDAVRQRMSEQVLYDPNAAQAVTETAQQTLSRYMTLDQIHATTYSIRETAQTLATPRVNSLGDPREWLMGSSATQPTREVEMGRNVRRPNNAVCFYNNDGALIGTLHMDTWSLEFEGEVGPSAERFLSRVSLNWKRDVDTRDQKIRELEWQVRSLKAQLGEGEA